MGRGLEFGVVERQAAERLLEAALEEDLGAVGDLTSRTFLDPATVGTVKIVAREPGRLAGLPIVEQVFSQVDSRVQVLPLANDGEPLIAGQVIAEVTGAAVSLLEGERTSLNFLTHLSGIATITAQFVEAVQGTQATILDTRKTLPGWRVLEKYAVRAGGGTNHRMGLYDAVLIKDNHLAAWKKSAGADSLAMAIERARSQVTPGTIVEIEVDSLDQLRDALPGRPDIVLLDNMSLEQMQEGVSIRNKIAPGVLLEASGGITLSRVKSVAHTGVERISVGALTHSAPQLDLAFDWKEA